MIKTNQNRFTTDLEWKSKKSISSYFTPCANVVHTRHEADVVCRASLARKLIIKMVFERGENLLHAIVRNRVVTTHEADEKVTFLKKSRGQW